MPIADIVEVGYVIKILQREEVLDEKYVDHALSNNWQGLKTVT